MADLPGVGQPLELVIKNPARPQDDSFKISASSADTLGQLKANLQTAYPGNPHPEAVTLIYAGRLLKNDDSALSSFLPVDGTPTVLHIVVKVPPPSRGTPPAVPSNGASSASASQPTPPAPPTQPRQQPEVGSAAAAGPAPPNPDIPLPEEYFQRFAAELEAQFLQQHLGDEVWEEGGAGYLPPATPAPEGQPQPHSTPPLGFIPPGMMPSPMGGVSTPAYAAYATPAPASPLYAPAYTAAYDAALRVLMGQQQSPGPSEAGTSTPSAAASSPFGQSLPPPTGMPSPAITFVPTVIPMPQPVLPPTFFSSGQQQQAGGEQGAGGGAAQQPQQQPQQHMHGQVLMPVMPNPYAWQPHYLQHPYQQQLPQHAFHPGHPGFRGGQQQGPRQRRRAAAAAAPPPGAAGPVLQGVPERDLTALLRALQQRHGELPEAVGALLQRLEQREAWQHRAAQGPPVRAIHMRVQINVRTLLQLAVLLIVVYQHCPPQRFLLLTFLGLALYLTTTPPVRRLLRQLAGMEPAQPAHGAAPHPAARPPAPAAGNAAARAAQADVQAPPGAPAAAAAAANAGAQAAAAPLGAEGGAGAGGGLGGLFNEVQAFVVGFITSLLPGLDRNADDARNMGVAQDIFAADDGAGGNMAPQGNAAPQQQPGPNGGA